MVCGTKNGSMSLLDEPLKHLYLSMPIGSSFHESNFCIELWEVIPLCGSASCMVNCLCQHH